MSQYIRMNVGLYQGDIRGPFPLEVAKALIARGSASPTECIGDGKYRVIESAPQKTEEASKEQEVAPVAAQSDRIEAPQQPHKKARR
jgi:hypothetical protein